MTRRILRSFTIAEVSAVDKAAHRGPRPFMKRDDGDATMTETEQEYLSDASPKEKAAYLAASPAERKRILAQDAADDADDAASTTKRFTKADAERTWCSARDEYAKRHNLSFSQATMIFSDSIEGKQLYNKVLTAPAGPPVAKQARSLTKAQQAIATMDVSLEEIAKSYHPGLSTAQAITNFLKSDQGKSFYSDYLEEKAAVGIR
jgi:hypothetical protein